MFNRCWFWRRKLIYRADGALSARQWKAIEGHLARCPGCQNAVEADRALRAALQAHTGLLDTDRARVFDDRVIAKVVSLRPTSRVVRRHASPASFSFLSQLVGGAFAASALTAICLAPALHPGGERLLSHHAARVETSRIAPPVPLEWLLQTASPCAALLWSPSRPALSPQVALPHSAHMDTPASAPHPERRDPTTIQNRKPHPESRAANDGIG